MGPVWAKYFVKKLFCSMPELLMWLAAQAGYSKSELLAGAISLASQVGSSKSEPLVWLAAQVGRSKSEQLAGATSLAH